MRKWAAFLILILSLPASAALQELSCREDGEYKSIRKPGFKLTLRPWEGGCSFDIDPVKESGADYRSFTFYPDGHLMSFVSFHNQVDDERLSRTTGSKSFYFFPKKQDHKIFMDSDTGALKIVTVNGGEFFIDPSTGAIDEAKTVDFKVEQEPVRANQAGIRVSQPAVPMATFPYKTGNTSTADRNANVLLERGAKTCGIKANRLFNYVVGCRPESSSCPCNGNLSKKCSLDAADSWSYGNSSLDGVRIKSQSEDSLNAIISKKCPGFTNQPLQAARRPQNPERREADRPIERPIEATRQEEPEQERRETVNPALARIESILQDAREEQNAKGPAEHSELPEGRCLERLKEFFSDGANKDLVNEYVKIQGKITLHRIAWVYMKSSENGTEDVEKVIKSLLQKRDPEIHERFLSASGLTRNQKLLDAMGVLKAESEAHNSDGKNFPYTLKYGDVKMMELLVEAESRHGRSASEGVMDFTSIIKSSMRGRLSKKKENLLHGQKYVEELIEKSKQLESRVSAYLDGFDCKTNKQFDACSRRPAQPFDLGRAMGSSQAVLDAVYEDLFDRPEELKANFKWGTYWLHVR